MTFELTGAPWPVRWITDTVVYWTSGGGTIFASAVDGHEIGGWPGTPGVRSDEREDGSDPALDTIIVIGDQLAVALAAGDTIYVHHPHMPDDVQLSDSYGGEWSPDGNVLAFSQRSSRVLSAKEDPYLQNRLGSATLGVLDTRTGVVRFLGPAVTTLQGPTREWSADSAHLLVTW
jgi:hypothetical protein